MNRDEILTLLRTMMVELFQLDPDTIVLEARLIEDLDLDSIDAIDLAVKMQDHLRARVDEASLRKVRRVEDVVTLIEQMIHARDAAS